MILFFWAGQDRWAGGRMGRLKTVITYGPLNGLMSKCISPCEAYDVAKEDHKIENLKKIKVIWSWNLV